ncbi:MAG: hypothetical protein HFJ48_04110 [Clostridia bacterium]|nr:hypothetical protein [Clostridia bacterium]
MSEKRIEVDPNVLLVIQNSITAGVNEGVKRAMMTYDKEKKDTFKMKYDKRLRNTGLLLRNYRNFKEYCSSAIYEIEEAVKENVKTESNYLEIFDEIYNMDNDITIVQSILKAKERTSIILQHIDNCIRFYEHRAINTDNLELKRRVEVIKRLYINDEIENFEQIAEKLYVSTKTVNRDRKKAIEELAPLFFGVDGIKLS